MKNNYDKILNLLRVRDILESNIPDIDKAYEIYQMFRNSVEFVKAYNFILIGKDKPVFKSKKQEFVGFVPFIQKYMNQIKILEENGYFKLAELKYLCKRELELQKNAIENIKNFLIVTKESEFNFFENTGITEIQFDEYVVSLEKLQRVGFLSWDDNKLLESYHELRKNVSQRNKVARFMNIYELIMNGKIDNNPAGKLMFLKICPFTDTHNLEREFVEFNDSDQDNSFYKKPFHKQVEIFLDKFLPFAKDIIIEYIKNNHLQSFKPLKEEKILSTYRSSVIVTNKYGVTFEFSQENVQEIINYMNYYKIPLTGELFKMVYDLYSNGELDISIEPGISRRIEM